MGARTFQAGTIDALAGLVGLEIAEAHRPGVAHFLGIAAEMAALLEKVPLDDGCLDLAPVYALPLSEAAP